MNGFEFLQGRKQKRCYKTQEGSKTKGVRAASTHVPLRQPKKCFYRTTWLPVYFWFLSVPKYNGLKCQSLIWLLTMQVGPGSVWTAYLFQEVSLGLCWWWPGEATSMSDFIHGQYLHLDISWKLGFGVRTMDSFHCRVALCQPGGTVPRQCPKRIRCKHFVTQPWQSWLPRVICSTGKLDECQGTWEQSWAFK